jgi:hypothetical protein
MNISKGGLISEKFLTLAQISKIIYAESNDLAHFLADLSRIEQLSEIKPPLTAKDE